ncbi:MAG: peptidylprolyl isomerase [Thaumarchaeota archaeon]|nr:peptidylprolyl isomerase [Nitrososphaerota archaeon]
MQQPKITLTNSSSTTAGDTAVITTKYGDITLKLFNDVAPKTVANFEKLANTGFYNGTLFHRIVPGFVIQGGDPNTKSGPRNTWGTGDAGYTIPPEFSDMNFSMYTVGMARGQDVNSGSSQFFITVGDASFLDGKYTLFGQVTSGQDVVDKIAALQTNPDSQPVNPDDARIITIKATSDTAK